MQRNRLRVALASALALCATTQAVLSSAGSPAVAAATSYNTVTQALGPLQQNPRIAYGYGGTFMLGRDNATSFGYHGNSYWFFGDTFFYGAPTAGALTTINNSGSVTPDLDASNNITLPSNSVFTLDPVNPPTPAIAASRAETAFEAKHANSDCASVSDAYCGSKFAVWPGSVVVDPPRHRAIIFFTKICRFGKAGCQTGFTGTVIGEGIAVMDLAKNTITRLPIKHQDAVYSPEGRDSTLLWGTNGYGGNGFISGGYLYSLYGCDVYFRCSLTRAPITRIDDRAQWTFLTAVRGSTARWSRYPRDVVRVVSSGAAGGTLQWVPAMKRWLDIYAVPYANDVVWQTAPQPWGPWSAPQRLFSMMAPVQTTGNDYAAFAHPEYATNGGLVQYVSYYHAGSGDLELVQATFCATSVSVCTPATATSTPTGGPAR